MLKIAMRAIAPLAIVAALSLSACTAITTPSSCPCCQQRGHICKMECCNSMDKNAAGAQDCNCQCCGKMPSKKGCPYQLKR